ncbi:phage terminase small subunit P27 family [Actinomadura rayongensis]|uniref:Phage terminase small subunit P27 family n=1 Tax=Actinomadura rayongensis TaxID=1429076 RepID=A0A6I4WFS0_9ACTN|nr:phage terminase small subunit P27 family [Actinomadura rayongensis]MXQ67710.1 phage terminase small subunit P27 family [Actinomadura rayongensis]
MGRRGPAPKPTSLRVLHGEKPYRINTDEPQPAEGLPQPPAELDEAGRAIWDHVVAELAAMRLAHRADTAALHAYVEAVELHAQASVMVHRAGPLIKDRDGAVRTNPAVRVQREAARTMLTLAREFGLTPASRVHLAVEHVAEDAAARLLG